MNIVLLKELGNYLSLEGISLHNDAGLIIKITSQSGFSKESQSRASGIIRVGDGRHPKEEVHLSRNNLARSRENEVICDHQVPSNIAICSAIKHV